MSLEWINGLIGVEVEQKSPTPRGEDKPPQDRRGERNESTRHYSGCDFEENAKFH